MGYWNVGPTATGVAGGDRYRVVESMRGSTRLAWIPVLGLRYRVGLLVVDGKTTGTSSRARPLVALR